MVLEKLPPRDLNPIETPEGVPRLFDLIKPKEARFAPAFYKGVFNTLVAEDLVQAQRIGYDSLSIRPGRCLAEAARCQEAA